MKKLIGWVVVLGGLAASAYWIWPHRPGPQATRSTEAVDSPQKPVAPTTAVVTNRDIHFAITAAGEIGPLDSVSVRSEVGGLISMLTLDIGDKVKKSDVLFELDDKDAAGEPGVVLEVTAPDEPSLDKSHLVIPHCLGFL